jgi:hypothetical protein
MGFTPWPCDDSLSAVNNTYTMIQEHGDMVGHHLMEGIPWQESLDEASLPVAVENDIAFRVSQTQSGKVVYLSIDSLNNERNNLAPYWLHSGGNEPLPSPWDSYDFDNLEVANAYSRFALRMIDRFQPAYFNYAPEISELMLNDPDRFDRFKLFASRVYQTIKAAHPDLPLMVSMALKSPGSTDAQTMTTNFTTIADYVDVVGISVYPYAFFNDQQDRGDPANLPSDWLNQITAIAPDKTYAVTETGWIAEDLDIPVFGYTAQSDPDRQDEFVNRLLSESEKLSVKFIIWFSLIDYDSLWNGALGQDDIAKIWKDTGLYDGQLNPRPSLTTWDNHYRKTYR